LTTPIPESFEGFMIGNTDLVRVPEDFFTQLLPKINDLVQMKVLLYLIWHVEQQESNVGFFKVNEIQLDPILLEMTGGVENLGFAINNLVKLGAVLKADQNWLDETYYFINGPQGRAAIEAIKSGRWQKPGQRQLPIHLSGNKKNIFQLYEENIGPVTPMMADILKLDEATYPQTWIEEAVQIAVKRNARNWKFIQAILERWQNEGRGNEEDHRNRSQDPERFRNSGSNMTEKNGSNQPVRQVKMPGNPDCPICGGIGYLRQDLPIDHPEFGKIVPCNCRSDALTQSARTRLFHMSSLDALKKLRFDNFAKHGRVGLGQVQAVSLENAYNQAHNFAETRQGWLLMIGRYGCGKTHLAASIANHAIDAGISTLFLTVPDLLDWLRYAYSGHEVTFEERFEEIREVPLLILDDFGTQNATPWAQEKIFQIMNHRYINQLPTVVTSNMLINDFDGRIQSRLQDPDLVTVVKIIAPDYRNPTDDTGHPDLSSLGLHSRQTFGNFSLRKDEKLTKENLKDLQSAFESAREFADHPRGWLLLTGPYGSGKTHLAAAIGNYQTGLGFPPLMVSVPDLLDHLRATFNPNSSVTLDRRFEEIRTTRLLILDDLGTQSATPWAREKLYQLFNHRYNAELPTVITTTASTQDEMDPRLYSRMQDERICKIIAFSVPAYRGRK
jgi:DNA replication protein DnaC